MKKPDWIGLSEYAKHVGCSANVVSRAIDKGRIPASAVTKANAPGAGGTGFRIFINRTEADPAWVDSFNELSDSPTYPARLAVERIKKSLAAANGTEGTTETLFSDDAEPVTEPDKKSLAEVQRLDKMASAALKQIELLQKKEALVSRDAVYKQLFDAGQKIRNNLMTIPNRITADVLSAGGNHAKVRQILTDAIATSLEGLDSLYNSKIGS